MNKLMVAIFSLAVSAGFAFAESPIVTTGTTNPVVISPDRSARSPVGLVYTASTAYVQGDVVLAGPNINVRVGAVGQVTTAIVYMALSTGTSGTGTPTHTTGDVSDGTMLWRAYPTGPDNRPSRRLFIEVINTSSNAMYLSTTEPAVIGAGIPLFNLGSSWTPTPLTQKKIWAVSSNPTNATFAVQE